jgi:tetratricopeptide (TPR) repeat protein/transglutaminase-like putative cysteine protease
MLRRVLIALLLLPLGAASAQNSSQPAAKNNLSQEAYVVEQRTRRLRFENDGTSVQQTTAAIRVQSQAAVQMLGQIIVGYSSATEKLEINYVRVRKPNGEVVETPASGAQDFAPEVLQSAPMYSDFRERHITVMGLRPGDVLEYRTTVHVVTPLIPGEFWFAYSFLKNTAIMEERLQIEVPSGREVQLKSRIHQYELHEDPGYRTYTWIVRNIIPDRLSAESKDGDIEEAAEAPDIQLSTFRDWTQLARWYGRLQGARVVEDDAIRKKAAELTRGATTAAEKMRRIYDFVAKEFRYVSLSFGVGRFEPHAAPDVLQAGYGDCKDKHTLLAALLRAAGIQSYPVLANSERQVDPDIPSPAQFDHVVTAVKSGDELVWLDTTTGIAPFGYISYSLRNKQALLASEDANAGLRRIPAMSPVKNTIVFSVDGRLSETGAMDAMIDVSATGDSDWPLRLLFRDTAEAQWQDLVKALSFRWGFGGEISEMSVGPIEETAKPFHLRYRYRADHYLSVPNPDARLLAFPPLALRKLSKKPKGSEMLEVGPAVEVTQRTRIQFADNYTVNLPLRINLTRDYGEYSTDYEMTGRTLEAKRQFALKVNEIAATRRLDIESLYSVALNNQSQIISCSITAPTRSATAPAVSGIRPKELHQAALKALDQRDFATAEELLRRFVGLEPADPGAWDELGRARVGLNRPADALVAFRKQVEVNPFHARGYADLGATLQQLGRYEEAVAAFRKQLESAPTSKSARKNLGLLLVQMHRDQEARTELEAAASLPPTDPEILMALGQVYLQTGETEKGRTVLQELMGSVRPFAEQDIYAAALREDIDPDQTIRAAQKSLDNIGELFDAGAYDDAGPSAFVAMHFVALQWARIGWAKSFQGQTLDAVRYLESAWLLAQSGTAANRLARVYEKAGDAEKAKRMLALAAAAGGAEAGNSRERLSKLFTSAAAASQEIAQAQAELARMYSVKLTGLARKNTSAEFVLVFDGASRPQRIELQQGDRELAAAGKSIMEAGYPIRFPDMSSVKVLRRAVVSCDAAACTVTLKPLGILQSGVGSRGPS